MEIVMSANDSSTVSSNREKVSSDRHGQKADREILRLHKMWKRRQKRARAIRMRILVFFVCVGLVGLAAFASFRIYGIFYNPLVDSLTQEAGDPPPQGQDFLKEKDRRKDREVEFETDLSEMDLNHVGEYTLAFRVDGRPRMSTLIVEDHTAPKARAKTAVVNIGGTLDPAACLSSIEDATDVDCAFQEPPDFSEAGTVSATVILTDEGGNTTSVPVKILVVVDTEAPEILGVAPLTGFIDVPIAYKASVTVSDDYDPDAELTVDTSQVDAEKAGVYDIVYTATDWAGNTSQASTTITIRRKPVNYVEEDEVLAEAEEVLEEITTEDMSLAQIAYAIYEWARTNIVYVDTSEKDSWTNGAHQGFAEKSGDCYIYFATCKALLTQAGIPNIDVVKSDTSQSSHFWSLIDCGTGWYHFDATPRRAGGDFFMLTDEELLEYSEEHGDSHIFDTSLYPATPVTPFQMEES